MNLIKCVAGHFYDGDTYGVCPHCAGKRKEASEAHRPSFWGLPDTGFEGFQMKEEISRGSSRPIYHVQKVTDYAVKIAGWISQDGRQSIIREYEIARKLEQWKCFIHYERYEEKGNEIFLLQELATPWTEYVKQNTISVGDVLRVVQNLCDALSYMRYAGFIHLNVSPTNIFMKDGKVKLGDFSHAIPFTPGERYEDFSGKFPYLAPEIGSNGCCNGTEDIYSLGVTMYYMLTGGKLPFRYYGVNMPTRSESDTISTMFMNSELLEIMRKATAYQPSDRYALPEEMKEAVAGFMNSHAMEVAEIIRPEKEGDEYDDQQRIRQSPFEVEI